MLGAILKVILEVILEVISGAILGACVDTDEGLIDSRSWRIMLDDIYSNCNLYSLSVMDFLLSEDFSFPLLLSHVSPFPPPRASFHSSRTPNTFSLPRFAYPNASHRSQQSLMVGSAPCYEQMG